MEQRLIGREAELKLLNEYIVLYVKKLSPLGWLN